MKSTQSFTTVLIHREPVDTQCGINGLCLLVLATEMGELPSGQNLFVFAGKRRDSIKVLYFDRFAMRESELLFSEVQFNTRNLISPQLILDGKILVIDVPIHECSDETDEFR